MKKINFAKIVWILSIFLFLAVILVMIMDYKINYQYQTKNELYFYKCSDKVCVTEVKEDNHLLYSTYDCGKNACPSFTKELGDTYAILGEKDKSILFNYRTGKTISHGYSKYELLNDDHIIVTKNNKQGIIDLKNKITAPVIYDEIGYMKDNQLIGYDYSYIIAKKNNKYGIISIYGDLVLEPFNHQEEDIEKLIGLINDDELLL